MSEDNYIRTGSGGDSGIGTAAPGRGGDIILMHCPQKTFDPTAYKEAPPKGDIHFDLNGGRPYLSFYASGGVFLKGELCMIHSTARSRLYWWLRGVDLDSLNARIPLRLLDGSITFCPGPGGAAFDGTQGPGGNIIFRYVPVGEDGTPSGAREDILTITDEGTAFAHGRSEPLLPSEVIANFFIWLDRAFPVQPKAT